MSSTGDTDGKGIYTYFGIMVHDSTMVEKELPGKLALEAPFLLVILVHLFFLILVHGTRAFGAHLARRLVGEGSLAGIELLWISQHVSTCFSSGYLRSTNAGASIHWDRTSDRLLVYLDLRAPHLLTLGSGPYPFPGERGRRGLGPINTTAY